MYAAHGSDVVQTGDGEGHMPFLMRPAAWRASIFCFCLSMACAMHRSPRSPFCEFQSDAVMHEGFMVSPAEEDGEESVPEGHADLHATGWPSSMSLSIRTVRGKDSDSGVFVCLAVVFLRDGQVEFLGEQAHVGFFIFADGK